MRSDNLRVERAAIAATELSLTQCAELFTALPVVDHGTDLLAYQDEPFRVARIQVKGSTTFTAKSPWTEMVTLSQRTGHISGNRGTHRRVVSRC